MQSRDIALNNVGFMDVWSEVLNTRNATELPVLSVARVSVGIIVHNEEKNILNLLRSVSGQKLRGLVIDEVVVVSSGSEDKTNEFVSKHMEKDSRVRLLIQDAVEGKASAINEFLKRTKNGIVVISSGDVIFDERTLQNLVSPMIKDERIGLTSARPVPINNPRGFMGTVAEIHWRLHHTLERHGETIAFRKSLMDHIPDGVSADEAYVEAVAHQRAFEAVQVSDSLVFNKGSENVTEFLNQIRRHYVGHLFIKTRFSYAVSSMTTKGLTKVAKELLRRVRESPEKVGYVIGYVLLEALGRLLGIWDFYVKGRTYRVWHAAQTTKSLNSRDMPRSAG